MDNDYLFALELQKEFDREMGDNDDILEVPAKNSRFEVAKSSQNLKRPRPESNVDDLNKTCNLVHPEWETLDPAPDVKALFTAFDNKFFQSRLKCVTLEWSKRMYSCAGICYSRHNRFGMDITIRLSEPLLKLRTRKDLVETLLHEMIHAYCSVLGIREGNGGHGPNFKKIMYNINQIAGTNITVYHTFHDEVDVYKTHWWRCNGICQNRTPFLGYVKRTSNRAPGPNDFWWAQHLNSCGGTFMKIREPEKKPKGKKSSTTNKENNKQQLIVPKDSGADLRKFFTPQNSKDNSNIKSFNGSNFKGPIKNNGGGTLLINPKTTRSTPLITSTPSKSTSNNLFDGKSNKVFGYKDIEPATNNPKSVFSGKVSDGNLRNVVGLKDIENPTSGEEKNNNVKSMTGQGYTLSNSNSNEILSTDKEKLRNIWASKFPPNSVPTNKDADVVSQSSGDDNKYSNMKRRRILKENDEPSFVADESLDSKKDSTKWSKIDEDIMIYENNEVIDLSNSDEEINEIFDDFENNNKWSQITDDSFEERQKKIKQEILDESLNDLDEDDIFIIDGDYDDDILETSGSELADTSLVNDLFGDDTLIKDFHDNNAMVASNSRYHKDPQNDIISCPICQEKLPRRHLSEHLNGCVGITQRILPKSQGPKKVASKPIQWRKSTLSAEQLLKAAGYSNTDLKGIVETENENTPDSEETSLDLLNVERMTYPCPVCAQLIESDQMNSHLDVCLE